MLVLSRKVGEQIVLSEGGITVVVLAVAGRRVKLGVEAPHDVSVHREETWARIHRSGSVNAAQQPEFVERD